MGFTMPPKRLRREESFLGVHFDFHARADCRHIGRDVTAGMIERLIKQVRPDYLQCDCKGHAGYASYPTQVGYPAPGFDKDPLRLWRNATAKHGVALYMHYSGVWDTQAIRHHPSWSRIDEHGKRDKNNTSTFGPYVDKLLIPQLKELRDVYGVDGVWIDGDCWATCQDYAPRVLKAFRDTTGITTVPRKPDDPHFFEFTEFCREAFRRYLRHYVDALHEHDPAFQIASNWAFSSMMPEPVSANVDFLSGDYPLMDSVRAARMEARLLMHQGKPWDLMAWGFAARFAPNERNHATIKTAVQLQQEAAVVLSLGGGFQTYYKQNRDGAIHEWEIDVMAEVARFCRARQQLCHKAQSVPQVALLNSSFNFYRQNPRLFSAWSGQLQPLRGILDALLDNQYHVDALSEHHFEQRPMADYPVIVVPETHHLERPFVKKLATYVRAGGNLLVIGPRAAKHFQRELGVTLQGDINEEGSFLEYAGDFTGLRCWNQAVKLKPGTRAIGKLFHDPHKQNTPTPGTPAASIRQLGKGRILGVYTDLADRYLHGRTAQARRFLGALMQELFPEPMVRITGSHHVDVTIMRQGETLAINLVNTAGPHADDNVYTFDEIPRVGPLDIEIRLPRKPRRITLEPGGEELAFTYRQGRAALTVERLDIHAIVTVM